MEKEYPSNLPQDSPACTPLAASLEAEHPITALPPSTDPAAAFSAGGVTAAVEAEEARRETLTARAMTTLHIRSVICARLEDMEETARMRSSALRPCDEDAGVRGLTGNKEGWLDTIPEPFRRFAPTVFSDEAANELPPHRPDLDCKITVREGEKLRTTKVYDMSKEQLTTLKALLDLELQRGFIRPSKSSSSAPVFFVTDPPSESRNKGQLRLVVDYRDLNTKIDLDEYPIPPTRTVMARLPSAKIFTKFDVRSGFSNIRMASGSEQYTAFKTFFGLFEYQVMPMGLATAPSVFQRFINHVLAPYLDLFCFAYLDDIIIFSESEEEHQKHVTLILEALEKNSLHLKPAKCVWGVSEVSFLGYTAVAGKGIRMSKDKVDKISALEPPRNVREVREVLGLINFYGKFVPHYSDICAPINHLTGKDVPWNWTAECDNAFRRLLAAIREDVFIAGFDPDRPITLETDASDVAYGYVISQPDDSGQLRPVAMDHHKFPKHQINWDIHDKELAAIVHAFDRYRHFLAQPRFPVSVISDHRNLAKFMFSTDLLKSHDGRLGRWWQILSQARFVIEYRSGSENVVADFLSRYQQDPPTPSGHVLLPLHRFSTKAQADIEAWFKKSKQEKNIRQKLEDDFARKTLPQVREYRPMVGCCPVCWKYGFYRFHTPCDDNATEAMLEDTTTTKEKEHAVLAVFDNCPPAPKVLSKKIGSALPVEPPRRLGFSTKHYEQQSAGARSATMHAEKLWSLANTRRNGDMRGIGFTGD